MPRRSKNSGYTTNENEKNPLADESRWILGHEGTKQDINPTGDIYQDRIADAGQEIEDELRVEEEEEISRRRGSDFIPRH